LKDNFRIGQKVKVVALGWPHPELIGKIGIISNKDTLLNDRYLPEFEYCIIFPGWKGGHSGRAESFKFKEHSNFNCYNIGSMAKDKLVPADDQLEFDFENT
jgi:hypothetical protein